MIYTKRIFLHAENTVPAFEKRLSICLKTNGFSFSITDTKNVLYTFGEVDCLFPESLAEVINGIKQIFTSLNVSVSGYKSTELIMPSQKQTWIPEHLFTDGKEKEYLTALCDANTSESYFSNKVDYIQACSVFAVSNTLSSGWKIAIPSAKIKDQFSKMVEFPCLKNNRVGISVAAFVREEEIDIAVFDSGRFLFSNTFKFEQQEDLVYFVLNVVKQLKLQESKVTVYLAGKVLMTTFDEFRKFFANVKLEKINTLKPANEQLKAVARHEYALILS